MMKNDSALFYTCSLVEFIGRERKLPRSNVVQQLGTRVLRRIYTHADVLHSDVIANVANEFIELCAIGTGDFDNVAACHYEVPDYWTIGEVYERLIEDVCGEDDGVDQVIAVMEEVFGSWISDHISDYNTDFYYQSRGYLAACYETGEVLES